MIRSALFSLITNDTDLHKAVATRVYPDKLPTGPKYPSIVYQVVSAPRDQTQDGPSGLVDMLVRFSIYGDKMSVCEKIGKRLRALLNGYSGSVDVDEETVEIHGSFCVNESDFSESPLETSGGPVNITRLPLDFRVWHKE